MDKRRRIFLVFAVFVLAVPSLASTLAQGVSITRSGAAGLSTGAKEHFTGVVGVLRLFDATESSHGSGASVSFEPGARTAWHTHPRGQVLIVTGGVGRVQAWGDSVEEIRPGDVVRIAPGQKHWHGAAPTTAMTHLAIQEHLNGAVVEWMEHVTDAQYGASPRSSREE